MSNLYEWFHDDITWCINDECPHTECERNIQNRLTKGGYYSAADFRSTEYCLIKQEDNTSKRIKH